MYIPYCGSPPVPGGGVWNMDPVLLLALFGLGVGLAARGRAIGGANAPVLALGWVVLVLALISPLCNLSVALFSVRVAQHLVLMLVAAPLIALGMSHSRRAGKAPMLVPPTLAFAIALWVWHLPAPYEATFRSDTVYWIMHVTLFGTALWLWRSMLLRAADRPDAAALAALVTGVQMGVLGALLTIAPRPLFPAHAGTTAPWGLTPLEDQQLGGLLMWVPGGLLFVVIVVAGLAFALRGGFASRDHARAAPPLAVTK